MKDLNVITPCIKVFANGFQITFANLYTIIVKNGPGMKCTQSKTSSDIADVFMSYRFGGNSTPDVEIEIYSPSKENISDKFGEEGSVGYVTPYNLANLIYIVSSLK